MHGIRNVPQLWCPAFSRQQKVTSNFVNTLVTRIGGSGSLWNAVNLFDTASGLW